jgi:hypothetical protein
MALGTGAITLAQIRVEVGLGATASLADCFTAATGTFNPTYAIAGVQAMSEFRGYSHAVTGITISLSTLTNITGLNVCVYALNLTKYYDGGGIGNGMIIYDDVSLTTPYTGSGKDFRRISSGGFGKISTITGEVSSFGVCF